jgi:3-deoxy-D-manno-octulosonic-acid transferase
MARALYTLLWWLVLPLVPLRLLWRSRREPGYRAAIGERFGSYRAPAPPDVLWVHAVSVGETRAAAPLIDRLRATNPRATILLTCMTASGRDTGRQVYGDRVVQAWLPYDAPFAVRRFLDHWSPRAGLLMETELWPNLVHACDARGVPLFLVNARLSERSAAGYRRWASLARPMLRAVTGVAAQTEADAQRLRTLGARDVVVTGNLKFDVTIPEAMRERAAQLRERFGRTRAVWLCASTREGEEALLLDALVAHPLASEALLVLVPRHPQRFDEVEALVRSRGFAVVRRSSDAFVAPFTQVVVGDSMGEMLAYCGAADVAFVGGSLLPLGGQNLIEPIALGVPTLVGEHTFNFAEATERAIAAGAARRVPDARALVDTVEALLRDEAARSRMRGAALAFHAEHRGATDRLWQWLEPRLPAGPGATSRAAG